MRSKTCPFCGVEFELDEAEPWKKPSCAQCAEISRREDEILLEWERAQGYLEE
jgi:hypothetical protein